MHSRLSSFLAAALICLGASASAHAADRLKAIASFSILADMVKNVGGDRVEVTALVGPDADAHAFRPTPADAKKLAKADIFFVNGLGFEGWLERLETSSGFKGTTVVTTKGVDVLEVEDGDIHDHGDDGHAKDGHDEHDHDKHAKDEHGHDEHDHDKHAKDEHGHDDHDNDKHAEDEHDHEEHAGGHHHDHGGTDPHAWQSLANGAIYVANIRDGLIAADPDGRAAYEANAESYLAQLEKEHAAAKAKIAALPQSHRRIITSHDAFGYFGDAYGLEVFAPQGFSTESEPSANDVAVIIRQIREDEIPAVFMENITNPKMLEQIAKDSGANIGGTLYSDALSKPDGPASTYLDMFRHNIRTLLAALPAS